ncbi:MAG: hypothetical protein KKG10_04575, partial [Proteobacteria bacterium]|nr:hypothetical protein [Pseudomonadota bacterium]
MGGAIPPEELNQQCTAKGIGGQAWDHEGLSPKGRNKNFPERIERPLDVEYRFRAGRGDERLNEYLFLGLSSDEFQGFTAVP